MSFSFFFLLYGPPPSPTLFPYTTLSLLVRARHGRGVRPPRLPGHHRLPAQSRRSARLPGGPHPEQAGPVRSEEHTSELQSRQYLVCRLLLEKTNNTKCDTDYIMNAAERL